MSFTEVMYAPLSQVESVNLTEINSRLSSQWWDIDLKDFDHIAGFAPTYNTDVSVLMISGSQIQYRVRQLEKTRITRVDVRHADGATPSGQVRVQSGKSSTAGATSVVTVSPLQAPTDLPQSTNFQTDSEVLGTPHVVNADETYIVSLTNIGAEACLIHHLMVYFD